jgi:hypothetical protein
MTAKKKPARRGKPKPPTRRITAPPPIAFPSTLNQQFARYIPHIGALLQLVSHRKDLWAGNADWVTILATHGTICAADKLYRKQPDLDLLWQQSGVDYGVIRGMLLNFLSIYGAEEADLLKIAYRPEWLRALAATGTNPDHQHFPYANKTALQMTNDIPYPRSQTAVQINIGAMPSVGDTFKELDKAVGEQRQLPAATAEPLDLTGLGFVEGELVEVTASEPAEAPRPLLMDVDDSDVFTRIGYVEQDKRLYVTFKSGAAGYYTDVPPDMYDELLAAESKGRYWHLNIRPGPFAWHPTTTNDNSEERL